jgi:hypothetical protein
MQFIRVVNWERFQNYKNRTPPWIRLYNSILDNWEFSQLNDAQRYHLFGIWLLASRLENEIPYDIEYIKRKIGATTKVDLTTLVTLEFIEVYEDASKMLAPCLQDACLEESRVEEIREEKKPHSAKKRAASVCGIEKEQIAFDRVWSAWKGHGWSGLRKAEAVKRFKALRKREPATDWVKVFLAAFEAQAKGLILQKRIEGWARRQPDLCVWIEDKRGGVGERWKDEPYTAPKRTRKLEPHETGEQEPAPDAPDEEWLKWFGSGTIEDVKIWRAEQRK